MPAVRSTWRSSRTARGCPKLILVMLASAMAVTCDRPSTDSAAPGESSDLDASRALQTLRQGGRGPAQDAKEVKEPAPGGDDPLHPGCVEVYGSTDSTCNPFAYDHGDLCVDCESGDAVPPGTPTPCIREYQPTTRCGRYPRPASMIHDCRDLIEGGECVATPPGVCRSGWNDHEWDTRSALCVAL